jgi:hypothetical protein
MTSGIDVGIALREENGRSDKGARRSGAMTFRFDLVSSDPVQLLASIVGRQAGSSTLWRTKANCRLGS